MRKKALKALMLLCAACASCAARAQTLSVVPVGTNTAEIRISAAGPPFLTFTVVASAGLAMAKAVVPDMTRTYSGCTAQTPTTCVIAGMTAAPLAAGPIAQITYSGAPTCRPVVKLQSASGATAEGAAVAVSVNSDVVSLAWSRPEDLDGNGVIDVQDLIEAVRRILYGNPAATIELLARVYGQITASNTVAWAPCPLP